MRLAYNTNGLAHHRLEDALRLLADLGYRGVALTPDVSQLDPLEAAPERVAALRRLADELDLALAVETGARFVLDPRRKHRPNLLEPEPDQRRRRVDLLLRCVDLASDLGAGLVSLWAGAAPDGGAADASEAPPPGVEELWGRLCGGLRPVLERAAARGVAVAFEPEPGMFVERPRGYAELVERLGADGEALGLCLDVGHLLCTGDLPVGDVVRSFAPRLVHVHLDDIAGGVHEHRMFGEGDLDLAEALQALVDVGYDGMAAVELSRDSHRGAWAAEEALCRIRDSLPDRSRA